MKTYKVQTELKTRKQIGIGRVWTTIATSKRPAVAEHLAKFNRLDRRHQRPVEGRVVPTRII